MVGWFVVANGGEACASQKARKRRKKSPSNYLWDIFGHHEAEQQQASCGMAWMGFQVPSKILFFLGSK